MAQLLACGVAAAQDFSPVRLEVTNNICRVEPCPGDPPAPTSVSSGSPFSIYVAGLDAFNSRASDLTGVTASLSSSDPLAILPATFTFGPMDQGIRSFPNGAVLRTLGVQTITVTDVSGRLAPGTLRLTVNAQVSEGVPTIGEVGRLLLIAALALSGVWISYRNV